MPTHLSLTIGVEKKYEKKIIKIAVVQRWHRVCGRGMQHVRHWPRAFPLPLTEHADGAFKV